MILADMVRGTGLLGVVVEAVVVVEVGVAAVVAGAEVFIHRGWSTQRTFRIYWLPFLCVAVR